MIQLSKERKYLLIVGTLLLLAGASYRFYEDILNLFTKSEEVTFKETQLVKYQKALQEKTFLEAELLSVERELAKTEASLLSKPTPALAAVDIQNMINDLAEQKQIEIKSMRVLPPKELDKGGYLRVPLEVIMIASIRELKGMLFGIDNSRKLLKVSAARIRPSTVDSSEALNCTLVVEGFMKSEEKTP